MSKFQADSKLDRPITLQVSPSPSSKFFPRTPFVTLHCTAKSELCCGDRDSDWNLDFQNQLRCHGHQNIWMPSSHNPSQSESYSHCIVVKNIIMVISGADIWRQCLEINIWTLQIPPPADFENKNIKLKSNWDYRHSRSDWLNNSVMVSWLYWCDPSE